MKCFIGNEHNVEQIADILSAKRLGAKRLGAAAMELRNGPHSPAAQAHRRRAPHYARPARPVQAPLRLKRKKIHTQRWTSVYMACLACAWLVHTVGTHGRMGSTLVRPFFARPSSRTNAPGRAAGF
jgi:hypothetical protein